MKIYIFNIIVFSLLICHNSDADEIVMRSFNEFRYVDKYSLIPVLKSNVISFDHFPNYVLASSIPDTFDPLVYGGEVVDSNLYPALLWYISPIQKKCSASQIGPRTIITAAHCIKGAADPNTGIAKVFIAQSTSDTAENFIEAECLVNSEYSSRREFPDWSFCLLKQAREISQYETIHLNPIPDESKILIAGYGCKERGEEQTVINALTIGMAKVRSPVPGNAERFINLYDRRVAACPGDSGGPSFIDKESEGRVMIGINAKSNYRRGQTQVSGFSNDAFSRFYAKWIKHIGFNPVICGLNPGQDC